MSLRVVRLSKQYGQQKAVDDISFDVSDGEIVGFLGPNGAGKSTTMKVITGYIPATSGEVFVDNVNVADDPLSVKRIVGYLPEHNPLYLDMYVHEFLNFTGKTFGMNAPGLKKNVPRVIELCGLAPEQHKQVGMLSKGYRQRVGLAQALLHNPRVLILDEPTSGLDPNQIVEIRKVIREISKDKTVLFSTHIMQEVQALCDRVVVINKGKIVANDSLASLLKSRTKSLTVVVEFQEEVDIAEMKAIKGAREVDQLSKNRFRILSAEGTNLRDEIFRYASDNKRSLTELKVEEQSVESLFRELTATENQS